MDILTVSSQDWLQSFTLAITAFINGDNPYHIFDFWNPVWVLFPLMPFYFAPFGRYLMLAVSIVALMLVAKKMGARPISMVAFLLSPLVFDVLLWGNVEWLTLLGLAMNPLAGMWLLVLKPQMMLAPIAFILFFALRERGWFSSARLIILPVLALTVSFIAYGFWIVKLFDYSRNAAFSASLFPFTIPVGLGLFVLSLRRHDLRYALAATPMLFQYVSLTVWIVVPLSFVSSTRWTIIATLAMWIVFVIWRV